MHQWRFFKAGGFDQVSLERGEDFEHLCELDQKLWAALACPVAGLECDPAILALIDTDGDGRVRATELLTALQWTLSCLSSSDELLKGSDELPLTAINETTDAGAAIANAARTVLSDAGLAGAAVISMATAVAAAERLTERALNGDGVVSPQSSTDPALAADIQLLLDSGFAVDGRDGKPGVDREGVAAAREAAAACLEWQREAAADPGTLLPAGEGTAAACAALQAVRAKVDDFFARCRLAAFDARAEAALNREESAWQALAAQDLGADNEDVRAFPLARIGTAAQLPFAGPVNPAWAGALAELYGTAVKPLLGERDVLDANDWAILEMRLAPYADWQSRKPDSALADLDTARLEHFAGERSAAALNALIDQDLALKPAFDALGDLVKLIGFRRDLARLTANFVNFRDFYRQETPAVFQCGTLYLDQRSCTLCLQVNDAGKHATLAGMAGAYLAYCDCVRSASGESMQIVAAFTGGDSDNLMVGRNGIFYDRKGRDWDATITRIVDNPISVRQAFWAPYKKLVRFVEEQVAKRAASADESVSARMQETAVNAASNAANAGAPKKIDVGTVAALGVAVGSLGTAFGYFMKAVADVKDWQVPLLVLGLMLLISAPSMVMAFLKLRRRNIAPLLDANGWAVNARALISVPFGARLTGVATLPSGAGSSADRFATRRSVWPRLLGLVFIVWWAYAFLKDTGLLERLPALW